MAKKLHPENGAPATEELVGQPDNQPTESLGGLAEEVHVLLAKRNELAQKLSQEIEATERKLAELKRTAALLVSENAAVAPTNKEKPEGKPKKPRLSKTTKSIADSAIEDRPLLEHAAEPVSTESAVAQTNGMAHAADSSSNGEPG